MESGEEAVSSFRICSPGDEVWLEDLARSTREMSGISCRVVFSPAMAMVGGNYLFFTGTALKRPISGSGPTIGRT